MRRSLLYILALIILITPGWAGAQSETTLESMVIELWPEYDRAELLVIYRVTLPSDANLPVNLNFLIPAAVGNPNAVAVGPSADMVGDVPYDRQVEGEWARISFTASLPVIQFEYYDPGLTIQGTNRQFTYHWSGEHAVNNMLVSVQRPVGTESMSITPSMGSGVPGTDGLFYYHSNIGKLSAGETFDLSTNYQKTTQELSVERLAVQASEPVSLDTPGRFNFMDALPWALGVIGILLIVGGGWWYWQTGRDRKIRRKPARTRKPRPAGARPSGAGGEHVYCHMCGHRANQGDQFCRGCGTRLRTE